MLPDQHWLSACVHICAPAQAKIPAKIQGILITVAASSGSVPRNPGAKMLVTTDAQFDTIGGGHLEYQAIQTVRTMLAATPPASLATLPILQRIALGPSLGQCCGGVVHLLFEPLSNASHYSHFVQLQQRWQTQQNSWRLVALHQANELYLLNAQQQTQTPPAAPIRPIHSTCHLLQDQQGRQYLADPCHPWQPKLYLFGAGHVATYLIHACAHLPCHITWIDQREALFPAQLPDNVRIDHDPQTCIRQATPGTSFLVMTHQHTLDQQLVEAVLRRNDSLWLGLIGSASKRAQFEHRLLAKGILPDALAQLVCPVGIPGISSKLPAVIAAAICAQLLQTWQTAGQLDLVDPTRNPPQHAAPAHTQHHTRKQP